jgi:sec-independent protein translocase protein TatA
MPNIGPVELIIILVIALIVIGPGRLPDVGAALGKSIREFRKASSDLTEAARVDVSPQATPAPAGQAPAATTPGQATPNTLAGETPPNTLSTPPAAPSPASEPSTPTPSAPTVPAPVAAPPTGDDATAPPA